MRDLHELAHFRLVSIDLAMGFDAEVSSLAGGFMIPSDTQRQPKSTRREMLRCIASAGLGYDWDHVSVSTRTRCPPRWEAQPENVELFGDAA